MAAAPNEPPISAAISATAKILFVIIIAQCLLPEKFVPFEQITASLVGKPDSKVSAYTEK